MLDNAAATTLLLIRHGDVDRDGVLLGQVDPPLSAKGEAQLRQTQLRIADEAVAAVYSSDLLRAKQSAEILLNGRTLDFSTDAAFRELDMGRWDGRKMKEVWAEEPEGLKAWWNDLEGFVLPDGESMGELRARVLPALKRLVEAHRGETVVLVAHGGVNRVILFAAWGLPLQQFHTVAQRYGCTKRIRYFDYGNTLVELVNG